MGEYYAHFAKLSSLYLQFCHCVDETVGSLPDGRRWGDRWAWYAPAPTRNEIKSLHTDVIDMLQREKPSEHERLTLEVKNDLRTVEQLLNRALLSKPKGPEDRQKWLKDAVETREYLRYKALDFEKKTFE